MPEMRELPLTTRVAGTNRRLATLARLTSQAVALTTLFGSGVGAQELRPEPARMLVPASMVPIAPLESSVELFIDFAVILQIAGNVSAVVLGNAEIADASVVAPGTIALTGKEIGTTNVVILGPDGTILSELHVRVAGHKPGTVTVRRAMLPSIYACTEAFCRYDGEGPERVEAAQ